MKLNMDGTITFEMPGKVSGEALEVTLRRPRLEELFGLWEEVDRVASESPKAPEGQPDEQQNGQAASVVGTMRTNLKWTRAAVATLGPDGLYEKDLNGEPALANATVDEPGWFVNGLLAGQWLRHWQEVPLDLGPQT